MAIQATKKNNHSSSSVVNNRSHPIKTNDDKIKSLIEKENNEGKSYLQKSCNAHLQTLIRSDKITKQFKNRLVGMETESGDNIIYATSYISTDDNSDGERSNSSDSDKSNDTTEDEDTTDFYSEPNYADPNYDTKDDDNSSNGGNYDDIYYC